MSKIITTYIRENISDILKYTIVFVISVVVGIILSNFFGIGDKYTTVINSALDSTIDESFDGLNIIGSGIKTNLTLIAIVIFSVFTYICSFVITTVISFKGVVTGVYISCLFKIFGAFRGIAVTFLDVFIPQLFCVFGLILLGLIAISVNNVNKKCSARDVIIAIFSLSLMSFSIVFEQLISGICINIYTNIN